jgi:hypothetical protein
MMSGPLDAGFKLWLGLTDEKDAQIALKDITIENMNKYMLNYQSSVYDPRSWSYLPHTMLVWSLMAGILTISRLRLMLDGVHSYH